MVTYNEIINFEQANSKLIPDVLKELLVKYDGVSFDGGVRLYGLNEIREMNELLEISVYQPEYIAIGDDGGVLVFLIRQSKEAKTVYFVDSSDYNLESPYGREEDFCIWVETGCNIPNNEGSQTGSIYLVNKPYCKAQDLIKIKTALKLDISILNLAKCLDYLPFKIVSNIKYSKAKKMIDKTGMPELFQFYPNEYIRCEEKDNNES